MSEVVLAIVAHPDDEVIGCGGTLLQHKLNGDQVHLIFMTDGVAARGPGASGAKEIRLRARDEVCRLLDVDSMSNFDFPDNQMDSVDLLTIIKSIEKVLSAVRPTTVYTHWPHDLNVDHRTTADAVITACRPTRDLSVKELMFFEVLSSSDWAFNSRFAFRPNIYRDISGSIEKNGRL